MSIEQQIEITLMKVRPFIQRDGGDVEFVKLKDGIVYINLVGACIGCSLQDTTLTQGIEVILMDEVPGVLGVRLAN